MNFSPAWSRHFRALRRSKTFFLLLLLIPVAAHAQVGGSPFDTGFTAMQTLCASTMSAALRRSTIVIFSIGHRKPRTNITSRAGRSSISTGIASRSSETR